MDNNNGKGYYVIVNNYATSPTSNIYLSFAYGLFSRAFGIDKDSLAQEKYFKNAVGEDQSQKYLNTNIVAYSYLPSTINDKIKREELIGFVESKLLDKSLNEKELTSLRRIAWALKDKDLSNRILNLILEKFPNSDLWKEKKIKTFKQLTSLDEKVAMYQETVQKYDVVEKDNWFIRAMSKELAYAYARLKNYEKMNEMMIYMSIESKVNLLDDVAWILSGKSIEAESEKLEKGLEMSRKSLLLLEEEMANLKEKDPHYSERKYRRTLNYNYPQFSDKYALISYKLGNIENAVKYQKIAVEGYKMSKPEINFRYAFYLEKYGKMEENIVFMRKAILAKKANDELKEIYKRLLAENTQEASGEMSLEKLEIAANKQRINETKEKLILEDVPPFRLKNLEGKEFSNENLKGKIVIIDFWATWCGPCVASFPAMQKAVDKFKNDPDVVFVFIDTRERVEDKVGQARKFIEEKGHSFNVLIDEDGSAASSFEVASIPTKFVLDKSGKIRFRGSGFTGDESELVDEITILVDLLR